ncbi:hypothetical protein F5887DRAFT_966570 [Amanita rubescens]|nr:hypothetical protein F5887DRAFT_966570 [Amanita rubescens]
MITDMRCHVFEQVLGDNRCAGSVYTRSRPCSYTFVLIQPSSSSTQLKDTESTRASNPCINSCRSVGLTITVSRNGSLQSYGGLPPFLYKPFFTTATVLTGLDEQLAQGQDLQHWSRLLVAQDLITRHLIVTRASFNKQRSVLPDFQHEYIMLEVTTHPSQPQPEPPLDPVTLLVSRSVQSTLGLFGPALDTITIHDPNALVMNEIQLHTIEWQPNDAPRLRNIFLLIMSIHDRMPRYCLLKTSCYTFARAVLEAINSAFNGHQGHQQEGFFTRQLYFLGFIPVGITRAHKLAQEAVTSYQHHVQLLVL